jgi:hypothetical protein
MQGQGEKIVLKAHPHSQLEPIHETEDRPIHSSKRSAAEGKSICEVETAAEVLASKASKVRVISSENKESNNQKPKKECSSAVLKSSRESKTSDF